MVSTRSSAGSEPAAWAKCIAHAISNWGEKSRSKSSLTTSSRDPERRARFEREARLLATLNHPHIGAIYGLQDDGDVPALVLELVDGLTLAERIARGPLPMADALDLARQIAEALDAAHENGIVHRDLKPANIKVTPDGKVKVLDFGLAKVMAGSSASSSATDTDVITTTREGVVLGTVAYMSPEQARGKPVDRRTDIWAFGCVLFEMLTGRRAFDGDSGFEVVARVLERTPDWSALPASTPRAAHRLLEHCLEKDPRLRLRDIGDAAGEIEEARRSMRSGLAAVIFRRAPRVRFLATLVLIAVAATAWRVWIRPAPPPPSPTARAPVVVLVADFDNRTGDPVFDRDSSTRLNAGNRGGVVHQCVPAGDRARRGLPPQTGNGTDR